MYYNPQINLDRINNEINELEKIKQRLQQPSQQPAINQTFQLASAQNGLKYANSIDEVQRDITMGEVPYFSKDMSVHWYTGVLVHFKIIMWGNKGGTFIYKRYKNDIYKGVYWCTITPINFFIKIGKKSGTK